MTLLDQGSKTGESAGTNAARPAADSRGSGVTAPVFVDASGRRARRARRWAVALATPAAAYIVAVAISLMGGSSLPSAMLPIPGHGNADASVDAEQLSAGGGSGEAPIEDTPSTDYTEAAGSRSVARDGAGAHDTDGAAKGENDHAGTQNVNNSNTHDSDDPNTPEPDNSDTNNGPDPNTPEPDNTGTNNNPDDTNTQDHDQGASDNQPDTSGSSNDALPDQATGQAEQNAERPAVPTQANSNASETGSSASGQDSAVTKSDTTPAEQANPQTGRAEDRPDRSAAAATE